MIKAIFFDIDGTLVSFKTHAMPAETREALLRLRAAGVKLFLATGRNMDSIRFMLKEGLFDGAIGMNGQLCKIGEECVFANPVSRADLEIAVELAKSGEHTIGFLLERDGFVNRADARVQNACAYADMAVPPERNPEAAFDEPVYQIHYYGEPGSERVLVDRTQGLLATRWSPLFADVYPTGGGKDAGIRAICERLGIAQGETMAFGDGENDISMLRYAHIGVAMGNASDFVKSQADYVAGDVDEGGLARAVAHFEAQGLL